MTWMTENLLRHTAVGVVLVTPLAENIVLSYYRFYSWMNLTKNNLKSIGSQL